MVGFFHTAPPDRVRADFEEFLAQTKILDCSRSVADKYGEIFANLQQRGAIVPVNDIWIAASCIVAGVPLATRDIHFQRIPELLFEIW